VPTSPSAAGLADSASTPAVSSATGTNTAPNAAAAAQPVAPVVPLKPEYVWKPTDEAVEFAKQPIAKQIVYLLTELLFVSEFTIPAETTDQVEHGVHLGKLWYAFTISASDELSCIFLCFSHVFALQDGFWCSAWTH
jgi:hypothetical protein